MVPSDLYGKQTPKQIGRAQVNSHSPLQFILDETNPAISDLGHPRRRVDCNSRELQAIAKLALERLNEQKLRLRQDPTMPAISREKALEKIAKHERHAWALLDELAGKS